MSLKVAKTLAEFQQVKTCFSFFLIIIFVHLKTSQTNTKQRVICHPSAASSLSGSRLCSENLTREKKTRENAKHENSPQHSHDATKISPKSLKCQQAFTHSIHMKLNTKCFNQRRVGSPDSQVKYDLISFTFLGSCGVKYSAAVQDGTELLEATCEPVQL